MGTRLLRKTPAAVAMDPMAMVAEMNWATSTIQTAQFRGPGIRANISIIPSPVQTVYRAPLMPIQNLRKIPLTITQIIPVPNMAPLRVARITSPEPMYSDAQTMEGPNHDLGGAEVAGTAP